MAVGTITAGETKTAAATKTVKETKKAAATKMRAATKMVINCGDERSHPIRHYKKTIWSLFWSLLRA